MSFKSFISSKNPGKGLYIFVWVITWVPINIIVGLVDTILASSMLKSIDDWNTYVFVAFPIETLIYLVGGIFVYKKFKNLKISKVMPFVWIIGAISYFRIYSETNAVLENLKIESTFTSIVILVCYLILCIGFMQYFKKSKQW